MKEIKSYFKKAIEEGASDLHLVGGEKPVLRIKGELEEIEDKTLEPKELETAIFSLLETTQKNKFLENLELDFGYEFDEVRFRINLHRQNEKIGLSARLIPSKIPSPTDLHFEPILTEFTNLVNLLLWLL